MKLKFNPRTIFVVVLALILSACGEQVEPTMAPQYEISPSAVIAEGHFVPQDDLYLIFMVRGRVDEILVDEGDQVKEGDVLMRLADREQAEASLTAAQLELTSAQLAYDDFTRTAPFTSAQAWQSYMQAQVARASAQRNWDALNIDNIDDRIDDAEADVQDLKEDLEDAQDEFDKYADLNENNATRQSAKDDLDAAQEDYNAAVIRLEEIQREKDSVRAELDRALSAEAEAKRKFEATIEGPDAEQLALVEARLNNAKAQVAAAESALTKYELKAPFDGIVTDINVSVNEMVGPEKWAVQVADFIQWYVETSDLTELEVVDVTVGQKVVLVADALPDIEMSGVVQEISRSFRMQGGDILYTVRILVDDVDPAVRWGMTVEVTFESAE